MSILFINKDGIVTFVEKKAEGLWYETKFTKRKTTRDISDITEYVTENKGEIDIANENREKCAELIREINERVGRYTGYAAHVYGWCILNKKGDNIKIIVDTLKNPTEKTIVLKTQQPTKECETKNVDRKQLLTFLKKCNVMPRNSSAPATSTSNVPATSTSNVPATSTSNAPATSTSNVDKEKLERLKRVLYIQKPKHKRIEYQTCIEYDKFKYLDTIKE
jgi:hypothetical protein